MSIQKLDVLVIGSHPQIMETVMRLINEQPNWQADGATTDSEAIEKFNRVRYNLVLLGGGVAVESEVKLKSAFEKMVLLEILW